MKPRNDKERRITALSEALPPITPRQEQWAQQACFKKLATGIRHHWCSECGQSVTLPKDAKSVVCPHCGATLTPMESRRSKYNEAWYFTIITTCREYQVCRHFTIEKVTRKGAKAEYRTVEVVQNWIDPKGHETIIARPVKCIPWVYDAWNGDAPMTIKARRLRYRYTPDKYTIDAEHIYPYVRVTPTIRRNGYSKRFSAFAHSELFKLLLKDAEAERLLKMGQIDLLAYKYKHDKAELPYQHAIRIATKHGYIVKDASMWLDYLDLLHYFGLDTHNPHYICPSNLALEHDQLLAKKKKLEAVNEARSFEKQYRAAKGRFFGIVFGDENITVTVIGSVQEMEEGDAMHHCVFANRYFLKPDSLILSARDKSGNRIETIEVSLKTFQVVQSRGLCNQNTPYHDEIVKLVNSNIGLIKKAA